MDHPYPPHDPHSPSVMIERMEHMLTHTSAPFTIKRLNGTSSRMESPTPLIRAALHSFIFLTDGEALISLGDQTLLFRKGDGCIVPAGQSFSVRYYNNCSGYMGGFHISLIEENPAGDKPKEFSLLKKIHPPKISFDADTAVHIAHLFERLAAENAGNRNREIIRAYMVALLTEMDAANQHPLAAEWSTGRKNSLCNRFIDLVFDHFSRGDSISVYAEKLNVSTAHLHRVIKKHTGRTPLAWIEEAVIMEAKNLLSQTDTPIGEVATRVGILDPSYFARLFKKHVGVSPSVFRNRSEKS